MAEIIHMRRTHHGLRYRIWYTRPDAYGTPELTEAELRRALGPAPHFAERIERANRNGTSALGRTRDFDGPWETERCGGCSSFHHAYDARTNDLCRGCGEPEADVAHKAPCEVPDAG
jgi:hypothetical protein